MNIWAYVNKYTYSSPQKQINLLVSEAKKLNSSKELAILDVGGRLENREKEINKLGSRLVLDIQKGPNVDVIGDAHELPFPDKSFDVVTLFMVLEHLHDPQLALNECQRVLKQRGLLLLTTVQYWHKHDHPNDYYRYTKDGLSFLCRQARLKILKIWSMGGPFLVVYHAIELNLPELPRKLFMLSCPVFNFLDQLVFNHEDKRMFSDSVGWSLIAQK